MDIRAQDTATLCLFMDKLFDSMNGNFHKVVDGKIYRVAVKKNSPHHQLWRESIQVFDSMYFVNPVTKEKSVQPPTIKNWIKTIKGIFCLLEIFLSIHILNCFFNFIGVQDIVKIMGDHKVNSLLMRNFNQDSLENFFGALRALGYRNNNPNCLNFVSSYRTLLLNNLMSSHSPGVNCEDDSDTDCLTPYQTLFDIYSSNTPEPDLDEHSVEKRVSDGQLKN